MNKERERTNIMNLKTQNSNHQKIYKKDINMYIKQCATGILMKCNTLLNENENKLIFNFYN